MSAPNGGPAFPNPALANEACQFQTDVTGMSLRDYFAAKAMSAVIGMSGSLIDGETLTLPKHSAAIAEAAFNVADAMLAQRIKEN